MHKRPTIMRCNYSWIERTCIAFNKHLQRSRALLCQACVYRVVLTRLSTGACIGSWKSMCEGCEYQGCIIYLLLASSKWRSKRGSFPCWPEKLYERTVIFERSLLPISIQQISVLLLVGEDVRRNIWIVLHFVIDLRLSSKHVYAVSHPLDHSLGIAILFGVPRSVREAFHLGPHVLDGCEAGRAVPSGTPEIRLLPPSLQGLNEGEKGPERAAFTVS